MKKVKIFKRVWAVAVVALCLLGLSPQGRVFERHAAAQGSTVRAVARIPFELNGNSIFLQVRVNGSRPLWFVFDTGASGSVMNETVAQSLGLKAEGSGATMGAGGQVRSSALRGLTFDVGGALLKDLNVIALALVSLEHTSGRAMDGILGSELFRRYVVEVDYERKLLTLYEPSEFKYAGRGQSLPLTFIHNHPYVRAKVQLPDREPIEGEFVIDAGSNFQLILLPSFIAEHKLAASLPPTLNTYARAVGGEVALPIGRSARLLLGGFSIDNPVTAFPQSGMFGQAGKAGNIGSAILRKFKVTFDYSRKVMILESNKFFGDAYDVDMTGLVLASESPGFEVVRVNRVLEGTPAAEAGLRQGDEIIAVDSRPAVELGLAKLREMFKQPGRSYSLKFKRGADTLSAEIKTRRLV